MAAMKARREELTPAEVVTADGEVLPTVDGMPSPIKDPEAAHKWVVNKLAAFKDYAAAEEFWNGVVQPREADFFPPDFESLLGEWRKIERKFEA
jgi:hypothetical protein